MSSQYRGTASHRLFEQLGEIYKSQISGLVPVSIIETSESIDIAHQCGDRLPRAQCFRKGIGCDGVEPWPI
jgi:hypothetical protein